MSRRVVVTGLGAVTPIGNTVPEFWNALLAGKSGIGRVTHFDVSAFTSQMAGEVRGFEPSKFFSNPKDSRRAERFVQLAMAATKEAWQDAGLNSATVNPERVGTFIGSGIGGLKVMEDQMAIYLEKGPSRLSPFMIPMMISNIAAGMISMELNMQGPCFCLVSACASACHSVGEAWQTIRADNADIIACGGSEAAITPLGLGGFCAMRAVSTRNDQPEKACRPFDVDRDGFILGEGAGTLILEEYEHAKKRNAPIYGEITGYGASADAYHLTSPAPGGAGAARAMKVALKHSGLAPEQVSYINAHATSTPQGDIAETQAIKSTFGDSAKHIPISATKSMIGHLLGAAGAAALIACFKSLQTGNIHPTINLEKPDPECDLDYVPNTARQAKVDNFVCNSFGFGGQNACIIGKKIA